MLFGALSHASQLVHVLYYWKSSSTNFSFLSQFSVSMQAFHYVASNHTATLQVATATSQRQDGANSYIS